MLPPIPPSYEKIADDDELDHDGAPFDSPDPADITNADAFEELGQNYPFFATTIPDQPALDESLDMPDAPEQLPNDTEVGNTEAIIIEHFPSASAGAPIPGMQQGDSVYESQRGADGDSIWSPFVSECDWVFARWAKTRGPTSSAVTELLAIPEVWTSPYSIFALLT